VPGSGEAPSGRDIVLQTFRLNLLDGVNPSLQAAVLLGVAAIQINLSLLVFNLFPIPPLDGSRLLRNAMPYNAMQAYDRIPYWVSWLLMILIGGMIMRIVLMPMFAMVFFVLTRG
jgi:Zn-dependent protease